MNTADTWKSFLDTELPQVHEIIAQHGFSLESEQPHIKGERYLMRAVTTAGGQKLILLGKQTSTGEKVVIKITNDQSGKEELAHERTCRQLLHQIDFAYDIFHSPEELAFFSSGDYVLSVQKFVEQDSTFLDRPLKEQFEFALSAFKAQERARATTHGHFKIISKTFGNRNSSDYLRLFKLFTETLKAKEAPAETLERINLAEAQLTQHTDRIEQYTGFLTHTDFVPHNFRILGDVLYLLDFSSLRFGNKHESWARFLNFMTLYNPELEALLIQYMEDNRAPEERESLQLMRLFRLGEIITYYTNTLENSSNDLLILNQARVQFWSDVLEAELENTRVNREIVGAYQKLRDDLRSPEEKERQQGLH